LIQIKCEGGKSLNSAEAAVRRVEPFHFSPRCSGQETRLGDEVMAAFARPHS